MRGGLLTAPPDLRVVPRDIEQSWRRCVADAVPTAPESIDYREPDDVLPVLRRAARPVLERLQDSFADVPVAMVLSDATGRIVSRYTDVRRQREVMDRASAAEGFDFSERSVGTNGIGTVLVERRPMLVRGPEHYNTLLENLTCAGTPIVEPGTGRLVGSFSLACGLCDVHPLMTVMAGDIGRQIESRILDESGERYRNLVHAYLSMDRACAGALVVDEDTVLANRLGLAHTGPEVHAVLWRFLSEFAPRDARRMRVPLADGLHDALVEPVHDGAKPVYSVRLLSRRPDRRPAGDGAPAAAVPAGRRDPLHLDGDVDRQLRTAWRLGETVALTGSDGVGKLTTALRLLHRPGAVKPLVVEPHLDPEWFAGARRAGAEGRGLVLRRLHETPMPTPAQVEALTATGAAVVLTVNLDRADDAVVGLVRRVATTVRLPALARRREHLPSLVRLILAGLPSPASATTFSPAAWDCLMSWQWPGNLAELHNTVTQLARRAEGSAVGTGDLPDELRSARGVVGLMESAERDAVAEALRTAGGNRSRAATALGIGRTTLYRKMREFGLT